MKYISVASGIEASTMAWEPLGWKPVAFAEIDPFPSAALAHYYPDTPNLGDMSKFQEWPDAEPDVLVGGTPCQSFSIAGLRKGLDDPRGNLTLIYLEIARRYRPRWLVWENVPGVLSHDEGRTFGTFLGGLAELGYGFAYRVLDAQYFGLAQRRKRVFVVGHLGDWRRSAAVLFERESLSGNPAPSREAREKAASTVTASTGGVSEKDGVDGRVVLAYGGNRTSGPIDAAAALSAHSGPSGRQDFSSETFVVGTLQASGKAAGMTQQTYVAERERERDRKRSRFAEVAKAAARATSPKRTKRSRYQLARISTCSRRCVCADSRLVNANACRASRMITRAFLTGGNRRATARVTRPLETAWRFQ